MEFILFTVILVVIVFFFIFVKNNSPVTSWSENSLMQFLESNAQRRHALMIDRISDASKEKTYQALDAKYLEVELELKRRRSLPVIPSSQDESWLNLNSDLVSQVAESHNIDSVQAVKLILEKRKRISQHLGGGGNKRQNELLVDSMLRSHFKDGNDIEQQKQSERMSRLVAAVLHFRSQGLDEEQAQLKALESLNETKVLAEIK